MTGGGRRPPPRIQIEVMIDQKKTFRFNYVGELLEPATTPGLRYWADVFNMLRPGNALRWQPWNQVVCEKDYDDLMAKKGTRHPKQGWEALVQAMWDEPPPPTTRSSGMR